MALANLRCAAASEMVPRGAERRPLCGVYRGVSGQGGSCRLSGRTVCAARVLGGGRRDGALPLLRDDSGFQRKRESSLVVGLDDIVFDLCCYVGDSCISIIISFGDKKSFRS